MTTKTWLAEVRNCFPYYRFFVLSFFRAIVQTTVHCQAQDKSFGGVRNSLVGMGMVKEEKVESGLVGKELAGSWQGAEVVGGDCRAFGTL